jgi:hypothetical protein
VASNEEVQADLKHVTAMGKRLKLKGSKLAEYVKQHMETLGHVGTTVTTWGPGGNSNSKDSGFLSGLFGSTDDDDE